MIWLFVVEHRSLGCGAADAKSEFDWFDAAVLSYQMGRRIEMELDQKAP